MKSLLISIKAVFSSRAKLVMENAMLRYQMGILTRGRRRRVQIEKWDRPILSWFTKHLGNWRQLLFVVQPETVIRWHRKGFVLYWKLRFTRRRGRPEVPPSITGLIRRISRSNPLWGAPRIHGELLKLGIEVSQASVEKYMVRGRRPRPHAWKTFLNNHAKDIVAIDFVVVPTIRFRMLWALVVLSHDRRRIIHTAVTHNPSPAWTLQQMRNAFPYDDLPKFLLRDRDRNFWALDRLGVREIITAPRCPWQNGLVERVIGSIRRECTDHLLVLGERHLSRILIAYRDYYNRSRTHLSLGKDSPVHRPVLHQGRIVTVPHVGGLHYEFSRLAA